MEDVTLADAPAAADTELLGHCAELSLCAAEIDRINADDQVPDTALDAVQARWDSAVEPIVGTPARTPDGIRAKALALRTSLNRHVRNGPGVAFVDNADEEDLLAWSLVHDILGEVPDWGAREDGA